MSFCYIPPFLGRDVLGAILDDCTHCMTNDSFEFIAAFAPWRRQGPFLTRHWQLRIVVLRVTRAAILCIVARLRIGQLLRRFFFRSPLRCYAFSDSRQHRQRSNHSSCVVGVLMHPWWEDVLVSQSMLVPLSPALTCRARYLLEKHTPDGKFLFKVFEAERTVWILARWCTDLSQQSQTWARPLRLRENIATMKVDRLMCGSRYNIATGNAWLQKSRR